MGDIMKIKIVNVPEKEDGVEKIEIDPISVGDLLKKLNIDVFGVMVTRNGEVVREHDILKDNDRITISGMGCC